MILQPGDIFNSESEFSPDVEGYQMFIYTEGNGSRYCVGAYDFTNIASARNLLTNSELIYIYIGPSANYPGLITRGKYVGYPNDQGILPFSENPVNQIPWLYGWKKNGVDKGGFLKHVCTFAHRISVNHNPDSYMMGEGLHYDMLPDTPHTDDSNNRNRVALRYARGLCGHVYDEFLDFSNLPPLGTGYSTETWNQKITRMEELDSYLCDTCAANEFWVRDFITHLEDVEAWDNAFSEVRVKTVGDLSVNYQRVPVIDKSISDNWLPHATDSVCTWGGNTSAFISSRWWRTNMPCFRAAVKRWDRDSRVRM